MCQTSNLLSAALTNLQAGRSSAAQDICHQILNLEPNQPDALHFLGVLAYQAGNYELAIDFIERAIAMQGTEAAFHNNLGNVYLQQGRLKEAVACYRKAVTLNPLFVEANSNLADLLFTRGLLDEAAAYYRRVLETQPNDVKVLNSLGNVLQSQAQWSEAIVCYRQALAMRPQAAEIYGNLGAALKENGSLEEAFACCQEALKIAPNSSNAHNNLANVLKDQGRVAEAIASYREAIELDPSAADVHSNLLYALNFSPDFDAQALFAEHIRWNEKFALPLTKEMRPHASPITTDRHRRGRLRVGYVSADFRWHPIGRFILPLLQSHDRNEFEVFCYASQNGSDWLTERCRSKATTWRNVFSLSDEQLADLIRDDGIDILVDLSMHMANNRLLLFARKPAPVQVTYLAYPGTTGLDAIDYRLTDPHLDPANEIRQNCRRLYSEQSIWLPETYWCYMPPDSAPPVGRLPASQLDVVTFGCLNNFCKATDSTLVAWAQILKRKPNSRLLLHSHSGSHRHRVLDAVTRAGVSADRIRFVAKMPMAEYLALYDQIDIALDPFPYGGGTTTCDALWMGVPVVSLAGQTAVGRGGLSILSNLGLAWLAAHDSDQYVRIAVDLANDLHQVAGLRKTFRQRMLGSPLMDSARFAQNVEAAFREMWRRWCA